MCKMSQMKITSKAIRKSTAGHSTISISTALISTAFVRILDPNKGNAKLNALL